MKKVKSVFCSILKCKFAEIYTKTRNCMNTLGRAEKTNVLGFLAQELVFDIFLLYFCLVSLFSCFYSVT